MTARAARLLHPMRRRRSVSATRVVRALRLCDVVQQSATIEGFDRGRRKAAYAERKPLQAERGSSACSSTNIERPARRSSQARNKPTGPAPAIMTS